MEHNGFEHICIDILVEKKRYSINGIYRPPDNDRVNMELFLSAMSAILPKLNARKSYCNIICGDFNFGNIYNFNGGLNLKPLDNEGSNLFLEQGFSQLIDTPTRYCNLSTSLIDLIFMNKTENVILQAVLPTIADHLGTMIALNCMTFQPKEKTFKKYFYEDSNWVELKKVLVELDNPNFYKNKNINEITEAFTTKLIDGREMFVPNRTIKVKPFDQPWFNSESRKLMNKKNKKYREYIKLNKTAWSVEKLEAAHISYKAASKEYIHGCYKAKTNYFNSLKKIFSSEDTSPKKKFQLLKNVTNGGKCSGIPPLLANNDVISNPSEKAIIFNTQFAKKASIEGPDDPVPNVTTRENTTDLSEIHTNYLEIGPIIKDLKNASFSPCGLPATYIKALFGALGAYITKPLARLLNCIFEAKIYPDIFKIATITPIYKNKGAITDPVNFRPISILPTLSKITESVIHERLMTHLDDNKIISPAQAAYQKGDSTSQQLLYLVNKIREAWSKDKVAHAVFLDVSAAFDAVWHKGLIKKLMSIKVKGAALEILISYLHDRRARTTVEGEYSEYVSIEAGVPQGSRLGPLLFIIYINDLILGLESLPLIYADDTTLISSETDTHSTTRILNRDLTRISSWANKWKVKFNASKSCDLIFSEKTLNNSLPILFDQSIISRVGNHKHLGVNLTCNLNWDLHINNIVKQANIKLSVIHGVSLLDRHTLDLLYKMNIRSRIDYCLQVYGPSLIIQQLERLEKIQYSAARLVTGTMKFTSRARLYAELGWETIAKRIEFLSISHFHKIHTKQTRSLIRNCMPIMTNTNYSSRRGEQYKLETVKNKYMSNNFFFKAALWWNKLPKKMKEILNITYFKHELGKMIKPPKEKLYSFGSKVGNSYQTQLRVGRSQLNVHLFEIGLASTPGCLCGHKQESISHFLIDCFLYHNERESLLLNIRSLVKANPSKAYLCNTMLFGDNSSYLVDNFNINKQIFVHVQHFLCETKRLCMFSNMQLTEPLH